MILLYTLFWLSAGIIIWAMVGYRVSLVILGKIYKNRRFEKDYVYKPTVSVMVVVHNEEKVIESKLFNLIDNDYPRDSIEYIIASDFSTDATNEIVQRFIAAHPDIRVRLCVSKEHRGKTNAQNEAQKMAHGELLVMTDANSMFERNAISELAASFTADNIAYVTGRLVYENSQDSSTALSESSYWESDLKLRETESRIWTITAGNGAIYACRNQLYYDFDPLYSHDLWMPYYFARKKLRAIYNPDAVAYEKAGAVIEDEYKRKIRMNRDILKASKDGLACFLHRDGWFTYFYFGHRTCRYLLWAVHTVVYILSFVLSFRSWFYRWIFLGQTFFYFLSIVNVTVKSKNRILTMMSYYTMTILAQWRGVYNIVMGKAKSTWDKAESTR